jgi:putative ABC transport system ATP-binding protein
MQGLPDQSGLRGANLRKTFGDASGQTVAVCDVSVSFEPGQVSLIMGPSGCGKSTLIALLSGLLLPDAGQVVAQGQDVWALSEAQRRLFRLRSCGFIFQSYNLFPSLTAREQLEMVLRWGNNASRDEARRSVDAMLDRLGLHGKGDKLPIALSGGEKQRVAVGRALIKKPSLCFADEPTSALDWQRGKQVIELLWRSTREDAATVVLVSHDHRIKKYADQIIYMEDGRVGVEPPDADH